MHPEFAAQPTDELLELVWCLRERGDETLGSLMQAADSLHAAEESVAAGAAPHAEGAWLHAGEAQSLGADAVDLLASMEAGGLVRVEDGRIELTEAGAARARRLVRCHRLAERLLHDVLGLPAAECERAACLMEHVLQPAVAEAVCAFVGHPPTCPHGLPIPEGECCTSRRKEMQPLVLSLLELEPGRSARIVFMTPQFHQRLDRLASFGIVPGSVLRLRQRHPSCVVEIGGTSLALDADVAREIYVRRES